METITETAITIIIILVTVHHTPILVYDGMLLDYIKNNLSEEA